MNSEDAIKNLEKYIDNSKRFTNNIDPNNTNEEKIFKETLEESINAIRERDYLKNAIEYALNLKGLYF